MSDVALSANGGALANSNQGNFFESYGEQASQKSIVGNLLKFTKGDWSYGEHSELIAVNTSLIANMDELLVGWVRWANSKPTDQVMGRIATGYVPPLRNSLGDHDESLWERDPSSGKPRDPWQLTNYLILKSPVGDDLYTFATSSRGGLSAIGDLCKSYGKASRMRPAEFPIVALRVDSYLHPDKAYGRIKVPVLTIVGWAPKEAFVDDAPSDGTSNGSDSSEGDNGNVHISATSATAPATATKF